MRPLLAVAGAAVLAAVVVIGLSQADGGGRPHAVTLSAAEQRAALRGAPAALARLHDQASRLLPGGLPAFRARLRALRGRPVVVNKWASWCGPCRFEFPVFQALGVRYGRRIGFLGLNSSDAAADARRFLAQYPVSYPSYRDPDEDVARAIEAPNNYPITVFFDRRGQVAFVHQGRYRGARDLRADIRRYALGA
jgi:thiol-disulfide isomerase/thioredoxin